MKIGVLWDTLLAWWPLIIVWWLYRLHLRITTLERNAEKAKEPD